MRTFIAAAMSLLMVACSGDSTSQTDDSDAAGTTPPPQVQLDDTGYAPGGMANFMLTHNVNTGRSMAYAVGASSHPGFVNLAQCAVEDVPCLPLLPSSEDEFEDIDTDRDLDRTTIETTYLGLTVKIGETKLDYFTDPETGFGFYQAELLPEEWPAGDVGLKWTGSWLNYKGDADHVVSEPVEMQIPEPGEDIFFHNGDVVPIEWVPTGKGAVFLVVATRFDLARMFRLEDDGYFEVVVDDLGFGTDTEEVTFTLSRWDTTTIRQYGHLVDVVSRSDAWFTGEYFHIGSRDRIHPSNRCNEAQGQLPLETGSYWGYLSGGNNLDPNNGCLSGNFADARGIDLMNRVDIPSKHAMTVEYNVYDESASVYLVENCNNQDTCIVGADDEEDPNLPEFITYFNLTSLDETLYLILDETTTMQSFFTLDLNIDPLFDPDFYNTCDEAQAAVPTIGNASYFEDFLGYGPNLNPGTGGCTNSSLPGADMMTPLTLDSGQSVSIQLNMPGGDPAVYILYNCADEFSCPVGSDASLGNSESLFYMNASLGTENIYIVVDSKNGLKPFYMNVSIL